MDGLSKVTKLECEMIKYDTIKRIKNIITENTMALNVVKDELIYLETELRKIDAANVRVHNSWINSFSRYNYQTVQHVVINCTRLTAWNKTSLLNLRMISFLLMTYTIRKRS